MAAPRGASKLPLARPTQRRYCAGAHGQLRPCYGHANFSALRKEPMIVRRRQKPRRTQLERRNETQAAILSAAIDLLTEHGYAGFSASRVAARAGVSRGAQEHYFPKKNDLIAAATRYAMREAVEHARLLARTAGEIERSNRQIPHRLRAFLLPAGLSGDDRDHDRGTLGSGAGARPQPDRAGRASIHSTASGSTRSVPQAIRATTPNASSSSPIICCAALSLSPPGCRTASNGRKSLRLGADSRPPFWN